MRDFMLAVQPLKALPPKVSLRAQMPPVFDQGQLGSRTANSIGAILEFNELKQKEKDAGTPSRLFIYYNARSTRRGQYADRICAPHRLVDGASRRPRSCEGPRARFPSGARLRLGPLSALRSGLSW